MIQESRRQRSVLHAVAGMHHQVSRLVQHDNIVVLVDNIERNVFRFKRTRFFFGDLFHHHDHSRLDTEILGRGNTAHLDFASGNQFLDIGAGNIFHDTHKKLVDAFTGMLFVY